MGVANNITAFLNFLAILSSVPIMATGIWLASKPETGCIHYTHWSLVILGTLILLVALAGFVGAYWYKETLLAFYLCAMAILIGLLLFLIVFAFVVTHQDGEYEVTGRGYREYRLDGFSSWLREHLVDEKNWVKVEACLAVSNFCSTLSQNYSPADQFYMSHVSPLQAGCCKPPTMCGYNYVNPTLWVNPTNQVLDSDCYLWSNDQSQLCYNCNSCKASLLGNLRKEWRKANIILIVAVVVLIGVYLIACSAFKNAQSDDLFRRYKQGWA